MTRDIDKHIGNQVKTGRALRGMNQETLAQRIELSYQQVQKYESGINRISAATLIDIGRALELPLDFFIGTVDGLPESGRSDLPGIGADGIELLAVFSTMLLADRQALVRIAKSFVPEGKTHAA